MSKEMTFDDITGKECEPIEYEITDDMMQRYLKATEIDNPWYVQDSPFGGPIAPVLISRGDAIRLWDSQTSLKRPGSLHAKTEYEFINPPRPGKKLKVTGKIADIHTERGREWITLEALTVDEDGVEIARSRSTLCWPPFVDKAEPEDRKQKARRGRHSRPNQGEKRDDNCYQRYRSGV